MTINHSLDGSKLNVELEGRLDTTTSPSLEVLLTENRPVSEVSFDFAKLEYISSAIMIVSQFCTGCGRFQRNSPTGAAA